MSFDVTGIPRFAYFPSFNDGLIILSCFRRFHCNIFLSKELTPILWRPKFQKPQLHALSFYSRSMFPLQIVFFFHAAFDHPQLQPLWWKATRFVLLNVNFAMSIPFVRHLIDCTLLFGHMRCESKMRGRSHCRWSYNVLLGCAHSSSIMGFVLLTISVSFPRC